MIIPVWMGITKNDLHHNSGRWCRSFLIQTNLFHIVRFWTKYNDLKGKCHKQNDSHQRESQTEITLIRPSAKHLGDYCTGKNTCHIHQAVRSSPMFC